MTVRWSRYSGASSYKITATPKNSPQPSAFAQFSGNSVIGSVNSLSANTMYTMRVEAIDKAGNVLSSAELDGSSSPEVPTIKQAYSKQSDSITVEFSEVMGASGYILRAESEVGDFLSETAVTSSPGTVLQLQPYTDYTLSVMSVNSAGRSQPSAPVQIRTVVVAPQLNSTSPRNDTILVTWSPVNHTVLYTLCIIKEGSNSRLKINTSDPFMTFDDLEPGTIYCVKGTAWDLDGRPGDDLTVCQITRPLSPGTIRLFLTQTRSGGLAVYWQMVHGADVYLAKTSTGQNCSASGRFCMISPLSCGQNHSVTVTAENSAGTSNPSDPEEFITFPCPLEQVWVDEHQAGSCWVSWTKMPLVEYYIAFVKRDDGSEERCNTTDTTCHFYCMCGYTYLITMFTYNQAGSSPPGDVFNYTTIPCCPEDVTIALVSTETLEIMWSSVRGAELYETTAEEIDDVIHCKDTAPVCALSNLRCNTQYSVVVTACSEIRDCNRTCKPHTHETGKTHINTIGNKQCKGVFTLNYTENILFSPCSPEILSVSQTNSSSSVSVLYTAPNTPNTTYTVTAMGLTDTHTCQSLSTSCQLTQLPCGATYDVTAYARTAVGPSLSSYSVPLETGPCCPHTLTVDQVTQALTNVTWSPATGARSYVTALTSSRGHAKCHTMDTHCLMGCITCGTNYSVSLEAISRTGHKTECRYHGFSSSACCPSSVKLYRMANKSLRVYWHSSGPHNHTVDLIGTGTNHTCIPPPLSSSCDVAEVMCGDVYTMVVAPVNQDGSKVTFCPGRIYSVSCSGSNVGMVIYRGKRSVD
ncbi:fibronectin type III domain-containing protein 7-like [Oncorhynchus mykiss]|uniref:fibronectin type III domain-containing protein 7-like n=1 Tax=Oncorhynchus mykiss TaxID=8022 RepID=UPI0018780AA6|nr:fibronectin type III domain-containing protein 7-like [Oncorhynchus mykiss]